MMAYATQVVLGGRRWSEASEAVDSWTAACDSSGRMFWFNEVTHETTYADPSEYRSPAFTPHPCPVGASPVATPFDGGMSPAGYYTGYNGYVSPPATVPPANGYMPPAGSAYMSPNGLNPHQRQPPHQHHYQQHNDYPVETRPPRFTGGGRFATPHPSEYVQQQQQQQQQQGRSGVSMAPFGASSGNCIGYRWEECYRQTDGKKFWRHKETGAILRKDPYR